MHMFGHKIYDRPSQGLACVVGKWLRGRNVKCKKYMRTLNEILIYCVLSLLSLQLSVLLHGAKIADGQEF